MDGMPLNGRSRIPATDCPSTSYKFIVVGRSEGSPYEYIRIGAVQVGRGKSNRPPHCPSGVSIAAIPLARVAFRRGGRGGRGGRARRAPTPLEPWFGSFPTACRTGTPSRGIGIALLLPAPY